MRKLKQVETRQCFSMCYTQWCQVQLLVKRHKLLFFLFVFKSISLLLLLVIFNIPVPVMFLISVVLTNTSYTSPWQHPFSRGVKSIFRLWHSSLWRLVSVFLKDARGLKPEGLTLITWVLMCKKNTNTFWKVGSRWFSRLSDKTPTKVGLLFVQFRRHLFNTCSRFSSSDPVKHLCRCLLLQCNLRPIYTSSSHKIYKQPSISLVYIMLNVIHILKFFTNQTDC